MKVSEIFYSLQGEGRLAGVPSVFVRLAGCPLRCRWCDTKYAWDKDAGTDCSIEEIVQTVVQWPCKFIVITGGEPMAAPQLAELARQLKDTSRHITVETAGIVFVPDLACDLMSVSPKLSNSTPDGRELAAVHKKNSRLDLTVLSKLINEYPHQLKFVVDSPEDLTEIQQVVRQLGNVDSGNVYLMPQATTRQELLAKSRMVAELCRQSGFCFSQRLHILLFDGQRGT
jgi:7-carboxy-7-deazaguanine synthase